MSATCQMRTHAVQQTATPFKHLVSERVRLARTARDGAMPGLDSIALSTEVPAIFIARTSVRSVFTRLFPGAI